MKKLLFIFIGGGIGAISRYGASALVNRIFQSHIPWGTFFVNLAGSFALGLLWVLLGPRLDFPPEIKSLLMVGFLGAFTTFSTFSLETVNLFERGLLLEGLANMVLSVMFCLLAAYLGIFAGRHLNPFFG